MTAGTMVLGQLEEVTCVLDEARARLGCPYLDISGPRHDLFVVELHLPAGMRCTLARGLAYPAMLHFLAHMTSRAGVAEQLRIEARHLQSNAKAHAAVSMMGVAEAELGRAALLAVIADRMLGVRSIAL